nr:hypothetical protein Q903MT_gene4604 [Picea sitchensis]
MDAGHKAAIKNKTWELVDLPPGKGWLWVLRTKSNPSHASPGLSIIAVSHLHISVLISEGVFYRSSLGCASRLD